MFSRGETSRLKEEFWTAFGRYMSPVPSAEGFKINWVNYHTRIKDIYFRMDAGKNSAVISVSIEHRDPEIQQIYFDQFLEFKSIFHATLGEKWIWQPNAPVEGKNVSRIYKDLPEISVLNREQWPDLISFFKPRIIALDAFWENARYTFESLA